MIATVLVVSSAASSGHILRPDLVLVVSNQIIVILLVR